MPPSLNQVKGLRAETRALDYFLSQDYHLVGRNVLVAGIELDLILKKGGDYLIVEVKSDNFWRMKSPLSFKQRERLKKAALFWSESKQSSTRLLIAIVSKGGEVDVYPLDDDL